ncbi:hypothetical protein Hypma_000947 [Hypsizygus marmoreus]|uniref:Ubiquitin-like protease family profile domain-containing protein n=1 Tax=Hypsizygus marmoreus TaxID=39966 RepID=A0A369JGL0_HYPMA|nr:hypothetical protein Hypma_000947 [Hypsizygus marmoreus]
MIPDPKDREDITLLHKNYRDASGPNPTPWKNPPTRIPPPSSSRPLPPRGYASSPFSSERMGNAHRNKNVDNNGGGRVSNRAAGNRTAGAVMTSNSAHFTGPASKRRKVTNDTYIGPGVTYVAGRGNPAMKASKPLKQPQYVIDIDDDENEDRGVVINGATSDDLNIIDKPVSTSTLEKRFKQQQSHADTIDVDASYTTSNAVASGSRSVRDGPATKNLEQHLALRGEDSDDPIEAFMTSPPPPSKAPPMHQGRVRETVERFENMEAANSRQDGAGTAGGGGKARQRESEVANSYPGPHIDLKKTSLKNRMKGKASSQGGPELRDAFATGSGFLKPSSVAENGRNKVAKASPSLPISEWFMGIKHSTSDGLCMQWKDGKLSFGKVDKPHSFYLLAEREIKSTEYFDPALLKDASKPDVVLRFTTNRVYPSDVKGRQVNLPTYVMGDSHKGNIVVKLDREHSGWSDNTYKAFIKWIKASVQDAQLLKPSGVTAVWGLAMKKSDLAEVAHSRTQKQDHRQSPPERIAFDKSRRIPKRPAPDERDDSTPPPPGELGRDISQHRDTSSSSSRPASRVNIPAGPSVPVRRSGRNVSPPRKRPPSVDPDEVILCYPQGVPGAVNITNGDCNRLLPGEFLNDTLIEFGLKLWLGTLEENNPELAKQIHVFSSFFYKKLNKKNPEEGYESVRKWTAKIDIFSKKYIIVPINENLHWYLAIIYHPEHVLLPPPPPMPSPSTRGRRSIIDATQPTPKPSSKPLSTASKPPSTVANLPLTIPKLSDEPSSIPPSVTSKTPSTISQPPSVPTTRESSLTLEYPARSDDEVEDILKGETGLNSISCSVTVDIEGSPTATSTPTVVEQDGPEQLANDVMVISSSPLTEMEIDDHCPPPAFHRGLSKTVSDYEGEGSAGRKDKHGADVEMGDISSTSTSPDVHELFDDGIEVEHASDSKGVAPKNFYGQLSQKAQGKQKMTSEPAEPIAMVVEEEENEREEDDTRPSSSSTPKTYIFTMDSLGSKHPQAVKQLGRYLKKEAADKKRITETSDPIGKQAFVPVQPNYCDCGLYLLHFAQTFMTNPDKYCDMINSRQKSTPMSVRQKDWDDEKTTGMRERLRQQIIEMSIVWKNNRAAKEEAKRKEPVEVTESSEDEVDIVETIQTVAPTKARKIKATPQKAKAARIRGH